MKLNCLRHWLRYDHERRGAGTDLLAPLIAEQSQTPARARKNDAAFDKVQKKNGKKSNAHLLKQEKGRN